MQYLSELGYIFKSLIPRFELRWHILRLHIIPFICIVSVVMGFYYASRFVAPGWITYCLSSLSVALIGVTALARVNDIPHENTAVQWQVRRLGLVLVGAACMGLLFAPWVTRHDAVGPDWPAWREVMFRVGVLFTWMTTPAMPPWHRYISGEFKSMRVEVPAGTQVEIVQTHAVAGMYIEERRKTPREYGP